MKAALILFSFLGVACICSALEPAYMYIQPYDFQDLNVKHTNSRGVFEEVSTDLDINDGAWRIVPGLWNCPNSTDRCVSFESVSKPGFYLRNRYFELWLTKINETDSSKKDATFKVGPGLADSNWVSFESVVFSQYFISQDNFLLNLKKKDIGTFSANDATFRMVQTPGNQLSTFIQPWNCPEHRLRYQQDGGRGKLDILSTVADSKEASWILVPGLANGTLISITSANKPGYYLKARSTGEELWLDKDDGTDQFKKDATFKIVPGLIDKDAISFECAYKPGWFIQHWGFVAWVRKNEGEVFPYVATFRKTTLMNQDPVAFLADI